MGWIGAAVQGAAGTGQLIYGFSQKKKAKGLLAQSEAANKSIPLDDPAQMAYLSEVQNKRRMFESGASKMMGVRSRLAGEGLAQTQANIGRSSGGNVGGAVDSFLKAQRVAGGIINEAAAQEQQMATGLMAAEGALQQDAAHRRLQRQSYKRDLLLAQYAQMAQDANANISSGVGQIAASGETFASGMSGGMGGGGGGGEKSAPQQQSQFQMPQTSYPRSTPYSMPMGNSQWQNVRRGDPYMDPNDRGLQPM